MKKIKLHEMVALKEDIRSIRFLTEMPILLSQGQVGTVIDVLGGGEAYEVEFADLQGQAYAVLAIKAEKLMVLRYEPVDLLGVN
ncbi:MAG: DUF4926 domain-containing protein [Coleofasciculaceae cyanobacterium SM2_1_6]|nr:DUF4926 domain-containing protein [Coleofasciculaceae cyanobacterium SM2_1_6]